MVKIKICGLSRPCDIDAVNEERPDYIGFVFAKSRRQVTPEAARALRERLRADIVPVGVFVNETAENILAVVNAGVIDMIQLHGSEDEAYIRRLKALTDRPVIKAVAPQSGDDAGAWAASKADYLLLDSPGGGSGQTFDWGLIGDVGKPFFLAGGLGADNVLQAVERVRPFAVDASSGVETDGVKDPLKIKKLIGVIRNG